MEGGITCSGLAIAAPQKHAEQKAAEAPVSITINNEVAIQNLAIF
jgi:hypothetical protein